MFWGGNWNITEGTAGERKILYQQRVKIIFLLRLSWFGIFLHTFYQMPTKHNEMYVEMEKRICWNALKWTIENY